MKTKKDFTEQTEFALLLIGEAGTGKTCSGLCFPKPYFLNLDRKMANAVKTFPDQDFTYDHFEGVAGKFWQDITAKLDVAMKDPNVETIIIDSLSTLSNGLRDWLIAYPSARPSEQCGLKTLSEPMWGVFGQMIENLIMELRYSGKRLVLLCHVKMNESDQDRRRLLPAIGGMLKNKLASLFTDYWQCYSTRKGDETLYMIKTRPDHEITLFESVGAPHEFQVTPANMEKVLKGELK